MMKRKPKFYTFLATVVVFGLAPLAAEAATGGSANSDTPPPFPPIGISSNMPALPDAATAAVILAQMQSGQQTSPPLAQPQSPPATQAQQATPPASPPASSSASPSSSSSASNSAPVQSGPSPEKLLSASEASAVIENLSIKEVDKDGNKSAYLTGMYPAACTLGSNGKTPLVEVKSTASDSSVAVGSTQGFAVHDLGGFASCVKEHGGACKDGYSADGKKCAFISTLASPIQDTGAQNTIPVAYLNSINDDMGGSWVAAKLGANVTLTSQSDDAAARQKIIDDKKKARADAAKTNILACAQGGEFSEAYSQLQGADIDPDDRDGLQRQLDSLLKNADQKDLSKILKDCQANIDANKSDQYDTCASNLDDYFGVSDLAESLPQDVLDTETARRCKLGSSQAVAMTDKMARALTTESDVNQDQIDHAKTLLAHLQDTSDEGMGCDLAKADQKLVSIDLKQGVVGAEAQIKYAAFAKAVDTVNNPMIVIPPSRAFPQGMSFPLTASSCSPDAADTAHVQAMIDLWKSAKVYGASARGEVEVKAAESACRDYLNSALADAKSMDSEMKADKCTDIAGNPVDNPSGDCKALEDFQTQLAGIPTNIAAMEAQSIQSQQAVAQAAVSALAGQQNQQSAAMSMMGQQGYYGGATANASYMNPATMYGQQRTMIPQMGSNFGAQTGYPLVSPNQTQATQGAVYIPQQYLTNTF